ncbi:hypothetical protein [Paraburkholderia sp. BL21I4N1]|uniref:hypothetical protein n=1 Tax=Paraburkholderia sp. BL21I4N1 TaxID=1938801 RepID=UPI000CFAADC2|nr:hypothetical protein [Paraburkholderia sp. BL21I4N1]PQV44560.1 hypothetical protein B0G83_12268 [Paraburkholderia sp. BL21I4N1]
MTSPKMRSEVWKLIFRSVPISIVLNVFCAAITFFFYGRVFKTSFMPGQLAVAMLVVCIVFPVVFGLADKGASRLRSAGLAGIFATGSVYFTFGVTFYYFYFLFAPMPVIFHVIGVGGGLALTAYWMTLTGRDVRQALATSKFVGQSFEDVGDALHYKLANMAKLEAFIKARSPSGKLHMWLVMLVAPFSLVLGRILSPYFGSHGALFVGAVIMFPVSLWVAGLLVRQYLVMVHLPLTLERLQGKPVVLIE